MKKNTEDKEKLLTGMKEKISLLDEELKGMTLKATKSQDDFINAEKQVKMLQNETFKMRQRIIKLKTRRTYNIN